jgi:hypothetical protein
MGEALEESLEHMNLSVYEGTFSVFWERAQKQRPDDSIGFLTDAYIEAACDRLSLASIYAQILKDAACHISNSDFVRKILWYFHYCLFKSNDYPLYPAALKRQFRTDSGKKWPEIADLEPSFDEHAHQVYLLIALSGLDSMCESQISRSIPARIRDQEIATFGKRLKRRIDSYEQNNGQVGLSLNGCFRVSVIPRCDSFRLGRLRFQHISPPKSESSIQLHTFRNDSTDRVIALSADGIHYRENGQRAGNQTPTTCTWEASYDESRSVVRGSPVHPNGYAVNENIRLRKNQWTKLFGPDVPHLRIHIPDDGAMGFTSCGKSIANALHFFPKYFPEKQFEALVCTSWILDSQLQEMLSDSSNMVQFQRELYLYPTYGPAGRPTYNPTGKDTVVNRVFDSIPEDPESASAETSLQRAVLDRLKDDSIEPKAGGGFLLPRDLDWGNQPYSEQWNDELTRLL